MTLCKLLEEAENKLSLEPDNQEFIKEVAEASTGLGWVSAKYRQTPGVTPVIELKKISYFNTSCCAFLDAEITGLEIIDGEIRLFRWPNDEGDSKPKVLVGAKLRDVSKAC